jgi:hypothetical protein
MSEDHIGVQIYGVLYVKFEDAKKLREGWDKADAEIEKLRTALRGVLTYYNAPTPAEAKLKKAVLATPIEQARAALGEKE